MPNDFASRDAPLGSGAEKQIAAAHGEAHGMMARNSAGITLVLDSQKAPGFRTQRGQARMFQARFLHVGWLIIAPCGVGLAAQLASDEPLSRLAGSRLASKLAAIVQNGLTEADEPRLTTLTEQEINAYLQFQGRAEMPAGVTDVHIAIEGNGRAVGLAKVDLDQVREQSSGGWLDPLSYLFGEVAHPGERRTVYR